ncbi:MAG: hypothetical protein ACRC8S_00245 [Fimbriiglobus sp.]
MTPEQQKFLRNFLHQTLQSAVNSFLWKLPWYIKLAIIGAIGGSIYYWNLY